MYTILQAFQKMCVNGGCKGINFLHVNYIDKKYLLREEIGAYLHLLPLLPAFKLTVGSSISLTTYTIA